MRSYADTLVKKISSAARSRLVAEALVAVVIRPRRQSGRW